MFYFAPFILFIFKTHTELSVWLREKKSENKTIGFVPTMGALHSGHIALVDRSMQTTDATLVSIFINPKQFNNASDFEKYPVTTTQDIAMLEKAGCHAVYIPEIADVYPEHLPHIALELGMLNEVLEGPKRPGHFDGVVQIVHRFLNIIHPDKLFLGLKDYQQCKVIEALIKKYFPVIELVFCATEREASGLAKSSRNMRLSEAGRTKAAEIYKVLKDISLQYKKTSLENALEAAKAALLKKDIEVEYLENANANTLALTNQWQEPGNNVVLLAAYLEHVRLIDNLQF